MNHTGIRTWEDWRLLIHQYVPLVVTLLVGYHLLTNEKAGLLVAAILAVFSPALALINTTDGFRKWVYGLLIPIPAFLIGFGYFTGSELAPIIGFVSSLVGSGLATVNTPTSRDA